MTVKMEQYINNPIHSFQFTNCFCAIFLLYFKFKYNITTFFVNTQLIISLVIKYNKLEVLYDYEEVLERKEKSIRKLSFELLLILIPVQFLFDSSHKYPIFL